MRNACSRWSPLRILQRLGCVCTLLLLTAGPVLAITMANDPHGYHDLSWGIPLTDIPDLMVTRENTHTTDYEFRDRQPVYADIPVESVHLSTVDAQFARVTIRYRGAQTHKQVLQYLERTYGAIERLPGQMMRGLNQQYTWRGTETEITLTYEANRDRGFVFIESRNLAPRFQDRMSDTAE
ncbi:MAG TPA: hypothetical protein PKW52_08335 [Nitrospira sp.]|nr:hypothetical protein [Nitrospira sp. NTP1]HQR14761.1 hypothetical protein [Nitrospira sp.]HQV11335.1 hypothetical protein [Nitrospira sp.]